MQHPVAIWVMGPIASGKTSCIHLLATELKYPVIDQDAELEKALMQEALPLDLRGYDRAQKLRFDQLRAQTAQHTWDAVPLLRSERRSLIFETVGDKESLLSAELELNRQEAYLDVAILLDYTLAECLQRNQKRARVLPDSVVTAGWNAFNACLSKGMYEELFGVSNVLRVQNSICEATTTNEKR